MNFRNTLSYAFGHLFLLFNRHLREHSNWNDGRSTGMLEAIAAILEKLKEEGMTADEAKAHINFHIDVVWAANIINIDDKEHPLTEAQIERAESIIGDRERTEEVVEGAYREVIKED